MNEDENQIDEILKEVAIQKSASIHLYNSVRIIVFVLEQTSWQ